MTCWHEREIANVHPIEFVLTELAQTELVRLINNKEKVVQGKRLKVSVSLVNHLDVLIVKLRV